MSTPSKSGNMIVHHAKPYLLSTHAVDRLLVALDNRLPEIKNEHDADAPIKLEVDHSYMSYLEDSFATDVAVPASALVGNFKTEDDNCALPLVVKQESSPPNLFPEVKMEDIEVIDLCSDAETDDGLEQKSRSRVRSISGVDSDHGMSASVINSKRGQHKDLYTNVIRGGDLKAEVKQGEVEDDERAPHLPQKFIFALAYKAYKAYVKGIKDGNDSRDYYRNRMCQEPFETYLKKIGDLKGLARFDWMNYSALPLPELACWALSRSDEQETQLIEALRLYTSPEGVQAYLDTLAPEGLAQRSRAIKTLLKDDADPVRIAEGKTLRKQQRRARNFELAKQNSAVPMKVKATKQIEEQPALFAPFVLRRSQRFENKDMSETDLQDKLIKDGIQMRTNLTPLCKVTERDSFLIGRLAVEKRIAQDATEFRIWAEAGMTLPEKEEYNRLLWTLKGDQAKDYMLDAA
ncbi:hypothetical protein E4T43_07432 [Aureobasidium subglaciale]|nr:hypothetical protein E4T43_07432 [Aureobasidium subglaciale]